MSRPKRRMYSYDDICALGERRSMPYLVKLGEEGKYPRSFLIGCRTRVWWAHEIDEHYEKLSVEGLANQDERRRIAVKAAARSVEVRRQMGLLPPSK